MDSADPIDQAMELHQAGRLDEAAALYRRILQQQPQHVDALHLLGLVAYQQGDDPTATALIAQALALQPGHAHACRHLGLSLLRQGKLEEAAEHFHRALAANPNDAPAHRGLADAYQAGGAYARAAAAYEQAVQLAPSYAEAWWGLGCAHLARGDYAGAAASFQRTTVLVPTFAGAHQNLGKALFELGQVDPALDALDQAARLGRDEAILGAIAVMIPGSARADHRAVLQARRDWAAVACPVSPAPPVHACAGRPVRVGYVSSFFRNRNWMKPVWGLINHHDRDRFEIHLFSDDAEASITHGYRKDPRDRFHDISSLSNADAARCIREHEIDIVVDLNSYSRLSRLPLFAHRPAPVVASWFNLFATSGMSAFDYVIGDEHVFQPEEEPFYSERVVRVAGCYLTFEVTYPVPDVAPPPCRTRGFVSFGCLAPQYKITPEVIADWARILAGSPTSRLVLKNRAFEVPGNQAFVRAQLTRLGIAAERVELDGPAEHFAFLQKYAEIDVALDTYPYNGGTTTMEALWQGVPVLCFAGDRWAARISASLMRSAGLPQFVAADREQWVARAIDLANSADTPARLEELRRTMRDQLRTSPACDTEGFARNMEQRFLEFVSR